MERSIAVLFLSLFFLVNINNGVQDEFFNQLKELHKKQQISDQGVKDLTKKAKEKYKKQVQPVKPVEPKKEKNSQKSSILSKLRDVQDFDGFMKKFTIDKSLKVKKVKKIKKVTMKHTDYAGSDGLLKVGSGVTTTPIEVDESGYIISSVYSNNKQADSASNEITYFTDFECHPRPIIAPIPVSSEKAYWPSCYQLMQCSGCCTNNDHMICAPAQLENRSTTVWQIPYDGSYSTRYNHYALHHKSCECRCKIQPSDCVNMQHFDPRRCECLCSVTYADCPPAKVWSNTDCGCVCKLGQQVCGKNRYWSTETCSCTCNKDSCPEKTVKDPNTCYCVNT